MAARKQAQMAGALERITAAGNERMALEIGGLARSLEAFKVPEFDGLDQEVCELAERAARAHEAYGDRLLAEAHRRAVEHTRVAA